MNHWNNLLDFYNFTSYAFNHCTNLMGLDPSYYKLEFKFDRSNMLGYYAFPNKIRIYVNQMSTLGEDPNANKTYILQTIVHELFHSMQGIEGYNNEQYKNILEYQADQASLEFIQRYKFDIENALLFHIDENVLNDVKATIKLPTYMQYKDYIYDYRTIFSILKIDPSILQTISTDSYSYTKEVILTINNKYDNSRFSGYIVKDDILQDATSLAIYVSNTFLNYNNFSFYSTIDKDSDPIKIGIELSDILIKPFK